MFLFFFCFFYNCSVILDCPSCDTGYLNPSQPTRIMEKCNTMDCLSNNHKTQWYLYELRKKIGKPKLKEIKCTGGNPLPLCKFSLVPVYDNSTWFISLNII